MFQINYNTSDAMLFIDLLCLSADVLGLLGGRMTKGSFAKRESRGSNQWHNFRSNLVLH